MTTNAAPDPVNRWATEHYGFEDHATHQEVGTSQASSDPSPAPVPARQRRHTALATAGVLVVSLVAGFGGVAVAADGRAGGRGAGPGAAVGDHGGVGASDHGRDGDRGRP